MRLSARGALAFMVTTAIAVGVATGCGLFGSNAPPTGGQGNGEGGEGGSGSGGDVLTPTDAPPQTARIRLAYFPPRAPAPPLVDFCIAPQGGGAWQGPVQVSVYVDFPPGNWDVRVVAAGGDAGATPTCADTGAVDLPHFPALATGTSLTILARDLTSADAGGRGVVVLEDEPASSAEAKVRFVNATGDTVDYGLGGGIAYSALATSVAPGSVDVTHCGADGYCIVVTDATMHVDTTLRVNGAELGATGDLALSPMSIHTVFAGIGMGGDAGSGDVLVACDDGSSALGDRPWLAACDLTAGVPSSVVRFGDFVSTPLAGGVDVCVRYAGAGAFVGPILGGSPLSAGQLSSYLSLHAGFSYDAVLVAAGATSCANTIYATQGTFLVSPSNDTGTTVVAMGDLLAAPPDAGPPPPPVDASADAAVDGATDGAAGDDGGGLDAAPEAGPAQGSITYVPFLDYDGTTFPVVRAIHAAADAPPSLNLIASASGATPGWSFGAMPYGQVATNGVGTGAVDPRGFLAITPGSGTLFVPDAGAGAYPWSVGPSDHDTFFLYGGGDAGLRVVQCVEAAEAGVACNPLSP
jgi:hypothetical protein